MPTKAETFGFGTSEWRSSVPISRVWKRSQLTSTMENVFDLISRSVSNQQDIILLFVDLQSFGNFDWFPSLGPQPLNSSKFYGLQTLFQSGSSSFSFFCLVLAVKMSIFHQRKVQKASESHVFNGEQRQFTWVGDVPTKFFRILQVGTTELQLHWMKCNTFLEILILLGVLFGAEKTFHPPFKGHQNLNNRGGRTLLQRRSKTKTWKPSFCWKPFFVGNPSM